MKKFLTKSFLLVLAFCSLFCLVGCGDAFAKAEEVEAEEISAYINQEGVDFGEELSSGFRMKMAVKSSGVSLNFDIGILLDETGEDIEAMAAVIKISYSYAKVTMKAYVKDGMLYTYATGEGKEVVEFAGETSFDEIVDAVEQIDEMLDQIRDYLSSTELELQNVVFKKLAGKNEGDVKYQIKDESAQGTSTIAFAFENNELVQIEVVAKEQGASTTISFEKTNELNFPSEKSLANWG